MRIAQNKDGSELHAIEHNGAGLIVYLKAGKADLISGSKEEYDRLMEIVKPQVILKADLSPDEMTTTAVVLSPHRIDAHGDTVSPKNCRDICREFTKSGMETKLQHVAKSSSQVVENYTVHYPTPEDQEAAYDGKPHKAFRFVTEHGTFHSGDWIITKQHEKAVWNAIQEGIFTGESIGAWGVSKKIKETDLPQVDYIEIDSRKKDA